MRELDELEAIHEELLLDPIASLQDDDKGTLSDDDIGTFADDDDAIESDELLMSLREFEELEAINEELDPSTG